MKMIAYYLPQFHEVKENNDWWGDGFTEWTNVKSAKSLYSGHHQPMIPLNHRYYNLLDKKTIEWQTSLLNQYGLYGLCYYHYWFEGKMLLEKPINNLLNWKDINQNFCFCWANHDWIKTKNNKREVLIKQTYGERLEWERHMEYLMDYFKDDRYIKINNRPVFMVFLPRNIHQYQERLLFYDEVCKKNGFDGIFLVESVHAVGKLGQIECSDIASAITLREPIVALTKRNIVQKVNHIIRSRIDSDKLRKPMTYEYEKVVKYSTKILNQGYCKKRIFPGCFSGWDSTPRHGLNGYVIENNNGKVLEDYLRKQKEFLKKQGEEYVFFNAWNEWAEGMYLEPDEKNGYTDLETIGSILKEE